MKTLSLEGNNELKESAVFTTPEMVQRFRGDLEESTQATFKEIDKNKSISIDEARKKYLD